MIPVSNILVSIEDFPGTMNLFASTVKLVFLEDDHVFINNERKGYFTG